MYIQLFGQNVNSDSYGGRMARYPDDLTDQLAGIEPFW
jgi:hypothetical protein